MEVLYTEGDVREMGFKVILGVFGLVVWCWLLGNYDVFYYLM